MRNAELHPGMGHYAEMEKYYRSLPEAEILASPSLMQGMSMLCALAMDYEGSERWYGELQKFAERCGRQDAAGKQARSRLAWLDISLPQRGVNGLTETIPAVFRLLMNKEVTLPSFSVTSALPSIMNGGKDFSPWSKKDDLLYKTLRIPVEAVLGRDGVGLADCAIAESKFEKGEDVAGRMLALLPQLNEVRNRGTPDMEFAVSGLLARSQLANGQPADARRTIEALRERFAERGLTRFLPNMDAMLCRIDMHTGDLDAADAWYREKAPREPTHLNVMRRYQYLTQAMVELADGRPDAALLTLAPLEPYIQNCARIIDGIHLTCPDGHCPAPQAGRGVARTIDGGAGRGGGVPLHPHRQRIRHGGAAAAGSAGLGRRQGMAQAADGGGADAGGVLPPFPRTPPCPRRGADAHGTANSPSALRGQVQRRDRPDHGREAADRKDPRQPHPRQAGREAPGGGQDRREEAAAHSG